MTTVSLMSEVKTEGTRSQLTAADLLDWLPKIPRDAQLTAIHIEHGHQRDPVVVLVGLRAVWTEQR